LYGRVAWGIFALACWHAVEVIVENSKYFNGFGRAGIFINQTFAPCFRQSVKGVVKFFIKAPVPSVLYKIKIVKIIEL
jgi:hypothetical protein